MRKTYHVGCDNENLCFLQAKNYSGKKRAIVQQKVRGEVTTICIRFRNKKDSPSSNMHFELAKLILDYNTLNC